MGRRVEKARCGGAGVHAAAFDVRPPQPLPVRAVFAA
jgi:hypothetical protein